MTHMLIPFHLEQYFIAFANSCPSQEGMYIPMKRFNSRKSNSRPKMNITTPNQRTNPRIPHLHQRPPQRPRRPPHINPPPFILQPPIKGPPPPPRSCQSRSHSSSTQPTCCHRRKRRRGQIDLPAQCPVLYRSA